MKRDIMEQRPLKLIMAAACLLMAIVMYVVVGLIVGASASQMIPAWQTVISAVLMFTALLIGGLYMPEQRRKRAFGLDALVTVLLFLFFFGTNSLSLWFVPTLAISAIIIMCVALFWPT